MRPTPFLGGDSFKQGDHVKADKLNRSIEQGNSARAINAVGGNIRRGPGGTTLQIPRVRRGGGSSAELGPQPLDLVILTTASTAATGTVGVLPGCINNIVPTNILATFPYAAGTLYFLNAQCTMVNGQVTTATLSLETGTQGAPVTMNGAPTGAKIACSSIKDDKVVRVLGLGSPWLVPYLLFQAPVATPAPGLPPFDNYYSLQVSQ